MMPALGKSRSSSLRASPACSELDSEISFHPFNNNRNGSACCTRARSLAVRSSARNCGIRAMNSRIGRFEDAHLGRSTMKGVPAARVRCASCISAVVFPRPAGPSRTTRPLRDNSSSIRRSDSNAAGSVPAGLSLTAVGSTSGCPFVLRAQASVTARCCPSGSSDEVSDLCFQIRRVGRGRRCRATRSPASSGP